MRLLPCIVGEGFYEARRNRIRVEVGPRPVVEVPFARGGAVLLQKPREIGVLPYRAGALLCRRHTQAVRPSFSFNPLRRRKRFRLPGPGGAGEQGREAVVQQVGQELPDAVLYPLPVASLPVVRRGVIVQETFGMIVVRGGLDLWSRW